MEEIKKEECPFCRKEDRKPIIHSKYWDIRISWGEVEIEFDDTFEGYEGSRVSTSFPAKFCFNCGKKIDDFAEEV